MVSILFAVAVRKFPFEPFNKFLILVLCCFVGVASALSGILDLRRLSVQLVVRHPFCFTGRVAE